MGRKWANIVAKKTAKDGANSRIYAKFGIEIYAAAKSGDPDPHANQKLRFVIERAKTYNVPKHIIDRAIEKAKGSGDENYQELRYEGFGPNGSMVIVDALTNNVNRTAADVRAAFGKIIVYGDPEDFNSIQEALKEKGISEFSVAEIQMIPQNEIKLTGEDLEKFEKMIDALDDLEDVQRIFHNVELDD